MIHLNKNMTESASKIVTTDDGARLTLGQINQIISPVSINPSGMSALGFEPVARLNASRLYRESDLPAIANAIAAAPAPEPTPADDGARLTLAQINQLSDNVSINPGGMSALGFEAVALVDASRLYRESDLTAIANAIARHVVAAAAAAAA
jgi:hypothetical protein